MGCHAFLQGIFPTQGLNPILPQSRWILYPLSHQGSPNTRSCPRACWPAVRPAHLASRGFPRSIHARALASWHLCGARCGRSTPTAAPASKLAEATAAPWALRSLEDARGTRGSAAGHALFPEPVGFGSLVLVLQLNLCFGLREDRIKCSSRCRGQGAGRSEFKFYLDHSFSDRKSVV